MANSPVVKQGLSRKELEEAYVRLKSKSKRANDIAKREGEGMMRNLVTVGAAGGMGWYMGDAVKNKKAGQTAEEAQQISGIDTDLIVGGGALAAGMMKWGGKFSETLSAIGTGVLSGYAYRRGDAMGQKVDTP